MEEGEGKVREGREAGRKGGKGILMCIFKFSLE